MSTTAGNAFPKIGVVADDLTGANDTCGRLASRGWKAYVSGGTQAPRGAWHAVAFNARSRFLGRAQARAASRTAWKKLLASGFKPDHFFQKIDSTLRGFPSAEIEGLMDSGPGRWAAVVPAYPSLGRVTRQGRHWVEGKPLSRSEYARDPLSPPESFRVDRLFEAGSSVHVRQPLVSAGSAALSLSLARLLRDPAIRFITFDALTDQDLRCIVKASLRLKCRAWAGASGLAKALAETLVQGPARRSRPPSLKKVLVLAGTLSKVTLDQIRRASSSGLGPWGSLSREGEGKVWPEGSRAFFLSSVSSRGAAEALRLKAAGGGSLPKAAAEAAMKRLARAGGKLAPREGMVVLTGGHTLETFYALRGYTGNRIMGDLVPGIPYGRALGPGRKPLWIASKPGGFGKAGDLLKALNRVLKRRG